MPPYDTQLTTDYMTYLLDVKQRPLNEALCFMGQLEPFEDVLAVMGPGQFDYLYRRMQDINAPGYRGVKSGRIESGLRRQIDHEWKQWKRQGRASDDGSSASGSSRIMSWDDGLASTKGSRSRGSCDGHSVASGSRSAGWDDRRSATSRGSSSSDRHSASGRSSRSRRSRDGGSSVGGSTYWDAASRSSWSSWDSCAV